MDVRWIRQAITEETKKDRLYLRLDSLRSSLPTLKLHKSKSCNPTLRWSPSHNSCLSQDLHSNHGPILCESFTNIVFSSWPIELADEDWGIVDGNFWHDSRGGGGRRSIEVLGPFYGVDFGGAEGLLKISELARCVGCENNDGEISWMISMKIMSRWIAELQQGEQRGEAWNRWNIEIEVLEMEEFRTSRATFGGERIPDMR